MKYAVKFTHKCEEMIVDTAAYYKHVQLIIKVLACHV